MSYLPYYDKLDEKYKQIYLEWDKEKLIDHLVANIHNGEVLLERINKTIEYCDNSRVTLKSQYFINVVKLLKGEKIDE